MKCFSNLHIKFAFITDNQHCIIKIIFTYKFKLKMISKKNILINFCEWVFLLNTNSKISYAIDNVCAKNFVKKQKQKCNCFKSIKECDLN